MTPNIEHIDRVIGAIKAEKLARFTMREWISIGDCGTSACIGGHIDLMEGGNLTFEQLGAFLGVPRRTYDELFFATYSGVGLRHITKDMAIRALEDLKLQKFDEWEDYL